MALAEQTYTSEWLRVYQDADFETVLSAARRNELAASIAGRTHRHILEIGCALEPMYECVQDFDTYTIVEPSTEMSHRVMTAAAHIANVAVVNATIQDAASSLKKQRFDFIICSGVLHVVEEPLRFLEAVREVCDAETVCYFVVPNALSVHRLLALEMGLVSRTDELSPRDRRFGHNGVFDRDSLSALFHDVGFRIVRDGTFFIKPFTHDQMRRLLAEKILPDSLVDGLYRLSKYFPDHGCELFVEAVKAE